MGEFKHITVTAVEDEDEVIVAGVGAVETAGTDDVVESSSVVLSETEVDPAHEPMPESASDSEQAVTPISSEQSKAVPTQRKAARKDDYHETTLEDLEPGGMPLAQKIVIIAAVVCIIGALVYYFAVMR